MPGHNCVGTNIQGQPNDYFSVFFVPAVPSNYLFSGLMLFASTTFPYRLFFMFMILTVKKIACLTSVLNLFFFIFIYLFPIEFNLRQGQ